jgi:hypothetical protein
MKRMLGLAVAIVVPLTLATAAHAQTTYYDALAASPDNGVPAAAGQAYGGFGLQYSPGVPAGAIVMDQYGLLHQVPYVATAPQVVVQAQPRTTYTRFGSRRARAQARYQLPTGSLGGSAGNSGMFYPVDARYASYGSGYGVGPYGVVDNRMMWKW